MTHYAKLLCPKCQRELRVRTEYAGKVIACKYCGQAFVVEPRPTPAAAPVEAAGSRLSSLDEKIQRLRQELAAEDARTPHSPQITGAGLAGPVGAELNELAALWRDLEAARTERDQAIAELETLQRQVSESADDHEHRLGDLTAERDSLRTAHDQGAREAETLRGRIAELEQAQAEMARRHTAALQEAQNRWDAEREALQAQADTRHEETTAHHQRKLSEEQGRAAEALRQWQERHAAAERRLAEEQAALRVEIDRVHREWQARHEAAVRDHEQRLNNEEERAAGRLTEWQERHAEAQRLLQEERDALQRERAQHAARCEEVLRLTEELARHVEASTAAARREQELGEQLQTTQTRQQEAVTKLQAEAGGLRQRLETLEGQLKSERSARQTETEAWRHERQTLQQERDQAERRRRETEEQSKKECDRLKQSQAEVERRQSEQKQAVADKKALAKQLDAARRQLAEKDRQIAAQAKEQTRAAAAQQALREELAAAHQQREQECAQLRRDADSLRAERDAARAVPAPAPEVRHPVTSPIRERPPRREEVPAAPPLAAPEPEPLPPRQRFSVWACLPLGLFLWLASQPTGPADLTAEYAISAVFGVTLLLQFRLWDQLEEEGARRSTRPWRSGPATSSSSLHLLLFLIVGGNAAYLAFAFGIFSVALGAFLVLNLAMLAWYGGLRRLFPGPVAASQVALLKYPALVYLLAAPTQPVPEPSLLVTMALIYLCFSVFELLHDDRLRAASGSVWLVGLAMILMLGVSGVMAVALSERSQDAALVQAAATGVGALVFLALFWRRRRGGAAGVWAYLAFVVGFAWVLNFVLGNQAYALPIIPPH